MSKQYIITDPCYIIGNEEWSKICDQCSGDNWNDEKFNSLCSDALKVLSGTTNATACHTGFGDWSNSMHSDDPTESNIIQPDFFADSGMVCVVEYNDKVKAALEAKDNGHLVNEDVGGAAIIEIQDDSEIDIEMNTDDENWTQVAISTPNEHFWSDYPYDEEDEEEIDDWYDEDADNEDE